VNAARQLVYAQAAFLAGLVACVLVTGEGFTDNHGLSFYGEHLDTLAPYAAGTLCCAWFLWRAAAALAGAVADGLRAASALLVVDLLSPPNLGTLLFWVHVASGSLLFLVELALAALLVVRAQRPGLVALLGAQLLAGFTAMFSQLHVVPLLSWGILLYQLAFGALAIAALRERAADVQPALS